MKTTIELAALALVLSTAIPAAAQDAEPSIVGAWRMTSLEVQGADGTQAVIPYTGQLVFTEGGTLSVQAMDANPQAAPTTYTVNGYEAYYGPVAIDNEKDVFTITVQSSLVRDLIGQQLSRNFEVTADNLVITPVNAQEGWRVTYERF